jgi:hypothetical protein
VPTPELRQRMARVSPPSPAPDHGGLETDEADAGRELVWTRPQQLIPWPGADGYWVLVPVVGEAACVTVAKAGKEANVS